MKNSTIYLRASQLVKSLPSSGYKMGDKKTLIVTMPDGTKITATHDAREYYSGRGKKYNKNIRHGDLVEIMTLSQLNKAWKPISKELKEQAKRDAAYKLYLSICNNPAELEISARKVVDVVGKSGRNDSEGSPIIYKTELDVYRGCGVYRIGWRAGKITCGIYGGYHNSCPNGVKIELWIAMVNRVMMDYSDHIIKMDGSGTEFFFRSTEDSDVVTNAVEMYYVPSAQGGYHLNIKPATAEVVAQKQLN